MCFWTFLALKLPSSCRPYNVLSRRLHLVVGLVVDGVYTVLLKCIPTACFGIVLETITITVTITIIQTGMLEKLLNVLKMLCS